MGRHAKKSKKSPKRPPESGGQKSVSSAENVAYYFLAAIGAVILVMLAIGLLAYFKVF